MGLDYDTYIGPYFECMLGENKKGTVPFRNCPNENCEQHGNRKSLDSSVKFCPNCGQAIVVIEKGIETPSVDAREVRRAVYDKLTMPVGDSAGDFMDANNIHIWIGNKREDNIGLNFDPTEETKIEKMGVDTLSREKAKLEEFYSEELLILKKFYGENNVSACWGLINVIY